MENCAKERKKVTHAEKDFDPGAYIDFLKNFSSDVDNQGKLRKFITIFLHDIFRQGEITGDSLLDVGTGPVCYTVYAASRWFKDITLSDVSEANLEMLRLWKAGKRRDLDSVFKFMIQLDGNREDLVTGHKRLSKQVKSIVHCDLRKENLLSGTEAVDAVFDAIVLCLSQICASFSCPEYKRAINSYSRHLKPNGHVIVLDVLEGNYYTVGQDTFRTGKFERDELKTMYHECGYEIIEWRESEDLYDRKSDEAGKGNLRKAFGMVARKV